MANFPTRKNLKIVRIYKKKIDYREKSIPQIFEKSKLQKINFSQKKTRLQGEVISLFILLKFQLELYLGINYILHQVGYQF